jgi:hypothetical protein
VPHLQKVFRDWNTQAIDPETDDCGVPSAVTH